MTIDHIAILRRDGVSAMNRLERSQGFMMHESELTAYWEKEFWESIDGGKIQRARRVYNRMCKQIDAYESDGLEIEETY